jgi:hypothetical protein
MQTALLYNTMWTVADRIEILSVALSILKVGRILQYLCYDGMVD